MYGLTQVLESLLSFLPTRSISVAPGSEKQSSGTLTVTDKPHKAIIDKRIAFNSTSHIPHGLKVFDPGFQNTAVTESSITYIDGHNGNVYYRQHSVEELFQNNDFEEVAFLLIWGSIPSPKEKAEFRKALTLGMNPPSCVVDVVKSFPYVARHDAPPYSMILAGLAAYTTCDECDCKAIHKGEKQFLKDMPAVDRAIIRTLSASAVVVALAYCHRHRHELAKPDPGESFIANILLMMNFVNADTQKPAAKAVNSLERLWILYADHELSNSTAAFLHASSTLTDPISCILASAVSGFGPLHGGAMDIAQKTFERVGALENVPALIADVKAKKFRLFGYGHRVYKTTDPRSRLMRSMLTGELSKEVGRIPLLAVALEIDRVASTDPYFTSRNLKANADLYGNFVYAALGFEQETIIPLAMISRTTGALAHWHESMKQPPCLWRPQQIYKGMREDSVQPEQSPRYQLGPSLAQ